jgi:hypothetical protein
VGEGFNVYRTDAPAMGGHIALPEVLLREAARRWRGARNAGQPTQPALHAVLAPRGWEMMAPVIDSLMVLCECRMGQAPCSDCAEHPSSDEQLLCGLFDGEGDSVLERSAPAPIDAALRTAIVSARLMADAATR